MIGVYEIRHLLQQELCGLLETDFNHIYVQT